MRHLDEGTLHALLDGELELAEVKEIQTHLVGCTACGSRLQDVKQFLAEADRLVGAIDTPDAAPRARREPAPPPQTPPPNPKPWPEPVWDSAPQILLPEDTEVIARRRRWNRRFRWAAMILVVIGAGQAVKNAFAPGQPDLQLSERDVISAAPETAPAVVSPEETVRREPAIIKDAGPAPVNRTRPPVPARPPEPKVLAAAPAPDTARYEVDSAVVGELEQDTAPGPPPETVAAAGADTEATERPSPAADLATRQAAAAALEELDRERLRSRANAATAALPPPRPEPQPAAEAPAPPAPRTLEQRAQIYLRIGLDEAARQLGRPMHVIEAMSPEFIGLAQGRLVAGADPARPVVRVVYRDTRGRMILLDQQRLRTGQAPGAPSGNLRWTQGDVMLYLHGDPGPDVLRNLQRRVR
jgi:hypothetical protein